MLPKSRLLSFLVLSIGVALLVAGLVAPRFLPGDSRLPLDLAATTWTLTDDEPQTRLMTDPGGRVLDAPVTRQLHVEIQNPADEETVTLRVGETLMRDSLQDELDRLISAEVWTFGLDRTTGGFTTPATLTDQLASPVSEVPVEGVWLKFPSDAQQATYAVFEPRLRQTRPAEFAEELDINGRTIHRYRQNVEPTNVAELYASPFNTTTFADGERGYLFHSVTRDFLVDRVSGLVVEIREDVDSYYGTVDGEKREQVLLFEGQMPQQQIDAHLRAAGEIRDPAVVDTIRWAVMGVGGLLILLGLVGAAGVFSRRRG
ncbi:DUF3068 domain-containing protein [Corynebacterium sp. YIM 101645]|uniref:DUF3068 domain-containing protein n=1 Tax=Corynebacterium lemuris TaxID=1859292 RepID=A0ABT2FVC5_9CORY|nr:DUF3068 domain-containing protein [Corynebacterium lemuris]MCS5478443.1 DUF3068 domain-containing protein [Corynebacterium lemuris]